MPSSGKVSDLGVLGVIFREMEGQIRVCACGDTHTLMLSLLWRLAQWEEVTSLGGRGLVGGSWGPRMGRWCLEEARAHWGGWGTFTLISWS